MKYFTVYAILLNIVAAKSIVNANDSVSDSSLSNVEYSSTVAGNNTLKESEIEYDDVDVEVEVTEGLTSLEDSEFEDNTNIVKFEKEDTLIEPIFSLDSGFYSKTNNFSLSLSGANTIYYTLDSTDPTTSSTAIIYNSTIPMYDRSIEENVYSKIQSEDGSPYSITIKEGYKANPRKFDKVTIVRAASKSKNGQFSKVVTKVYVIMDPEKINTYTNINTISIVTNPDNLFDKDKGIYVCGQKYIDWTNQPDFDPNFNPNDKHTTIANYYSTGKEWEREATVTFFKKGQLGFTKEMGIRIKGASSRNNPIKSFNLYARADYDGESKLNYELLDDNTSYIDGKLIKKYDSFGIRTCRGVEKLRNHIINFAIKDIPSVATFNSEKNVLFLDGEFWGLYDLVERASPYYIQTNYNIKKENVAIIKNQEYDEEDKSDFEDYMNLVKFCKENDLSLPENYEVLLSKVDLESLLDFFSIGLFIGVYDWPENNSMIWRNKGEPIEGNPYSDGKWRYGMFDFDYSLGISYDNFGFDESYKGYIFDFFERLNGSDRTFIAPIFRTASKNKDFQLKFTEKMHYFAEEVFETTKMNDFINKDREYILPYILMTNFRWNNGDTMKDYPEYVESKSERYYDRITKMIEFFENRKKYVFNQMDNFFASINNNLEN